MTLDDAEERIQALQAAESGEYFFFDNKNCDEI